jgi:signal transduction histidine kinase
MLHNLFSSFVAGKELIYSVLAAVVAATVFHPARQKIQRFVDKSFYRQMYDYRKAVSEFGKKSEECLVPEDLAGFLLEEIERILPADYLGIYLSVKSLKKRKLILEKGNSKDLDSLASEIVSGNAVFSRIDSVRTHEKIDFSKEELLEEMNLCLVIPFSFQLTAGKGFLTVGEKKSGERFTGDDIELLLALSRELALNLERLSLQVEIIREKAEKEKLDELSRQKSEFISILSHELRTPMSSIQCLSEMLQRGKISSDRKRMELITLMAGECERLSRFLHNILDFGKIERRSKTYNLERTKLQPVIQEATALFGEAGKENGIFINLHMGKKPVYAEVDRDALMQALINLIDNAMKYSLGKKEVDITLVERKTQIEIQVRDRGMGINEEDRKKIFQSFYRTREGELSNPHGVGLGLKIVRHIMEAHKGKISMAGAPEKGSIFSLIFPKP